MTLPQKPPAPRCTGRFRGWPRPCAPRPCGSLHGNAEPLRGRHPRPHLDNHPAGQAPAASANAWTWCCPFCPTPSNSCSASPCRNTHANLLYPTKTSSPGDLPKMSTNQATPVYWPRVKELLDGIMERWIERTGGTRTLHPRILVGDPGRPGQFGAQRLSVHRAGQAGSGDASGKVAAAGLRHLWADAAAGAVPVAGRSGGDCGVD